MLWWQRVDRLARTSDEGSEALRWRGRFVVTLSLFGATAAAGLALVHLALGAWADFATAAVGAAFCVGLISLWTRFRSPALIANVFASFASLTYFAGFVVNRDLSNVAWLAVQPMLALFLGGRRLGTIWLLIEVVLVGAGIAIIGASPPMLPPTPGLDAPLMRLAVMMLVVFAIGVTFETSTNSVLQQLRVARDAAEEANRAKSRFLANVSHELRTPLNGLLGMAELMDRGTLGAEQREQLNILLQSGRLLRLLIDDVLEVTSLEAGRRMMSDDVVTPFELGARVARQLEPTATSKGITIAVDPRGPELSIRTEELRVTQVLTNLLGNAIKFTARGSVRLVISTHAESEDWARVRFDVHDTGPGIPAEHQSRIFEPFSRLVRDASIEGTGLGLAITRTIAQQLGAELSLESKVGEGSVFSFEFRRPRVVRAKTPSVAAAAVAPVSSLPSLEVGVRVLVVDDNAVNLKVASGLLKQLGCQIFTAPGGAEAIALLEKQPVDLIFMDLHMPDPDGLETTRRLRASGLTTPIITLSASIVASEFEAARAAGMNHALTKPIRLDDFRNVLKQFGFTGDKKVA